MSKLLKLEKVYSSKNVKELRNLYDQIESQVRSLLTVGISSEHYGPLLIPIVLEKLPKDIQLELSKKLGTNNWKIEEFMKKLKEEITARENCAFIRNNGNNNFNDSRNRHFTTDSFITGSRVLKCSFCKQNLFSDKCTVVTDLNKRKEII